MRFVIAVLFLISGMQSTNAQPVIVDKEEKDSVITIAVQNNLPVDITMHFVSKIESLDVKEWHILSPETGKSTLFSIHKNRIPEGKDFDDAIRIFYQIGKPGHAQHDDHYRYRFPFASGKSSKIIQGYYGSFSHSSAHSRYAIDFKMAIGDTVFAAREGLVVWVVEHNTEGGNDRSLINKANEIIIQHKDGSMAVYTHLDHQGSLVEIGDEVKRGQAIGICGFTGFTTTPHLHFLVRIIDPGGETTAIPIIFEKRPGKKLKEGKSYRH